MWTVRISQAHSYRPQPSQVRRVYTFMRQIESHMFRSLKRTGLILWYEEINKPQCFLGEWIYCKTCVISQGSPPQSANVIPGFPYLGGFAIFSLFVCGLDSVALVALFL